MGAREESPETYRDADAIADLALRAASPSEVQPGHIYVHATPDGHELIDLLGREDHLAAPSRKTGNVVLDDAASFVAYVNRHKAPSTVLYASTANGTVQAVFNDHESAAAGWGDFTALLRLQPTKEWLHWASQDSKLMGQVAFAEHIEQGSEEIAKPPAAEMLELAQSFQATGAVAFESASMLQDGARKLMYSHKVEAKAGQKGEIKIPREFELGIQPYEGAEAYKVIARLRYRIANEALSIGYVLVRPQDVLRVAFGDVLTTIGVGADIEPLKGTYGA